MKNHTWWGQRACLSEPLISVPGVAVIGGKQEWVGQLYDAVVVNRGHTIELQSSFDNHSWVSYGNMGQDSLWLVIPNPE